MSCYNGVWVTSETFRPKHPDFSIVKDPFSPNPHIDTNYLYVQLKPAISYDGREIFTYFGFYPDGRLSFETNVNHQLIKPGNWQNALSIGYYRPKNESIIVEYFLPESQHRGYYETRNGIIKPDTIILVNTVQLLFKKENRYDTLIKSGYLLK
jgi:hypothetical protein